MPTEKRERQRANRAAARELAKRDEKRARLRRNALRFGGVAVAVIAVGFLLSRNTDPEPPAAAATTVPPTTVTATTTPPTTAPLEDPVPGAIATDEYLGLRALPVACDGELPPPAQEMSFPEAEDQGIAEDATVTATLVTSCGDIVLELFADRAPKTVNSFVFLAREGYYTGTVSHRIVPGFVYQAGDPTARGNGGPGYQYEDELPPEDFTYTRGTLAMANAGPNTNGSQFFIVFADSQLPPDFTVFGQVIEGLDVLDRIEMVPVVNQAPQQGVFIEDIIIDVK